MLLSVNGEDSYGGCAMKGVPFGGFLGRAPYCAARISASVAFRMPGGKSFGHRACYIC
jgi:hypothetical protein